MNDINVVHFKVMPREHVRVNGGVLMKSYVVLATLTLATSALAGDYKPDWQALQFYQEVSTCRSAIVLPAVQQYLVRGAAAKQPDEDLRKEVISLLPVFEESASAACYCAVNQAARARDFVSYFGSGDFTARMSELSEYVNGPICGAKMKDAVEKLKDRDLREAIRLH